MSSDIFSRRFDPRPFWLIYAGAQKNLGPAGVTLVIIRNDMLERVPKELPTMLRYTTYSDNRSLYNTPPCFAIYVSGLMLEWIEETVGGLPMEKTTTKRRRSFTATGPRVLQGLRPDSRSRMNVTFRLPDPELEKQFLAEAGAAGLGGLKGHRSVGGCRASIYNAVTIEAVKALVDFMKEFAARKALPVGESRPGGVASTASILQIKAIL
jgi:phosphoserine aminotransferase